jgi:SSS family solute:Na+ symporter
MLTLAVVTSHRLSSLDWSVIGAYGLGMLAVGVYYSFRAKTSDDYLLGGRNMSAWSIGLSLFATLLSTVSYLAVPSEMIHRGPMILFGVAAYPLIILIVGWFLIPRIMRFRVTTAYEILEQQLGLGARMVGSCIFVSMRLLWMAVIIYATSDKVLVPLAGLDRSATPWVCAIMGIVTLVYTSLGGLQAVVWTDVLQTFILFAAAIACLIVISINMGGVSAWFPTHWAPHWETFQFLPDGSAHLSLLDMMLSTLIWYVCTAGSDQMAIQRYLATRNARAARRAFIINQLVDVVVLIFCGGLGFALLGYYTAFPNMLEPGQSVSANADQLFPQFIVFGLPKGITGLVVAGLLAAAMSSLSSGMSSITSVVTVDFIDRFRQAKLAEADHLRLAKYISFAVGVITVLLSFLYVRQVEGNLLEVAYKVVNLLTVPLFLLFLMAMFIPFASQAGTLIGVFAATATAILIAYWHEMTGRPGLGFTWIMPASLIVGFTVACVSSFILKRNQFVSAVRLQMIAAHEARPQVEQ